MTKNAIDGAVTVRITRDREGLLSVLRLVDEQGWDGPAGRALLNFARREIARPLVIDVGLRGLAAAQAEASAWQAMWLVMTKPALRRAESPWGVLWRAAKRAALGEIVAARYGKAERRAWELRTAGGGDEPMRIPVSLDVLLASGWDVTYDERRDGTSLGWVVIVARDALVGAGWDDADASRIVRAVVDLPDAADDPRSSAVGWRTMAVDLGLPPWQARRLCVALRGTATWRGLFAQVLSDGPGAAESAHMRAALRATCVRRHRSPVLAAQLAARSTALDQQRAAR